MFGSRRDHVEGELESDSAMKFRIKHPGPWNLLKDMTVHVSPNYQVYNDHHSDTIAWGIIWF